MTTAIRVEGLGKTFNIGHEQEAYRTLRESIVGAVKTPFLRAGRLLRGQGYGAADLTEPIWALRDVSFEIEQGEVVGLIGSNGAGKSTLLKILSRITEPTAGYAEVRGRVGSLLEVGTGFHPELTGRENAYLYGAILGMGRGEIAAKFDQIVQFAEVERFVDTPVKHYSTGMYLRLAFAVAAHLEPEILLVDEVLAVGDASFQRKCIGKMGAVARSGRTVLFVSHNLGAISSLCDRSICLQDGRIVDIGDTASVIAGYVARVNEEMPDGGVSDLRDRQRSLDLKHRHSQFSWVKTLASDGDPKGTFLEHEPIVVEAGFNLARPASTIQLGCSVALVNPPAELFTVPSYEYGPSFERGDYTARLRLDPNFLRAGVYSLALKLFVDGARQDTIPEAMQLSVVPYVPDNENDAQSAVWVAGPLRLPYEWHADISRDTSDLTVSRR